MCCVFPHIHHAFQLPCYYSGRGRRVYAPHCIPATYLAHHTQIRYLVLHCGSHRTHTHVILVPRRGTRIIRATPILVLLGSIPLPFGCLRGNVRCCLVLFGHPRGAVNVTPSQHTCLSLRISIRKLSTHDVIPEQDE